MQKVRKWLGIGCIKTHHLLQARALSNFTATARGTLAKTAPVINQGETFAVTWHKSQELLLAFIHDQCWDAVRKQAAGAIEFFAVNDIALLGFADRGLTLCSSLGLEFS